MKLKFKHQKFQADAAKAVVDVFAGQPYLTPSYKIDRGMQNIPEDLYDEEGFTGYSNAKIVPELSDRLILENIQKVQRANVIEPSKNLEGKYNLTIEMETGVGKTYTYIKTMYELNKHYGWSKFIVIVPSIAIREGVYKSFKITQEHFAEEYGKKIRCFIYNSSQLHEIDRFASDNSLNVMIINSQAFNARGRDARKIHMRLDEFRSRRPISIIAKTNPILIIDEPQSVEGKQTKENMKQFNAMITLRYSATHKADSIYNMIYRLDAMEAYNKRLVKKISVKGITENGSTATDGYVYLESINLSKDAPTATIQFDFKGTNGIRKVTRIVNIGYDLYQHSGKLDEYQDCFVVKFIDGRDDSIEFINGIKMYAGDVIGAVTQEELRRIQIRETILSHIQRERQLFYKGIKVLSLFFIDEVDHYKRYDETDKPYNGIFANMFEEEYNDILKSYTEQDDYNYREYVQYLKAIPAEKTHAGYFSIDKKGKMTNSKLSDKKEKISDDINAYDLIMKNKELLLDRDPEHSPVRFIFSHSALREGWDNPNVFQICTLKASGSDVRKRQEVGRGLRLCVNQDGERMDVNALGSDVHNINVLTVIASESYDSFAKGLQTELAEAVSDRPKVVTKELFENRIVKDAQGHEFPIDSDHAAEIFYQLRHQGYIDKNGMILDKYHEDKENGELKLSEEVQEYSSDIINIIDSVYDSKAMMPENARSKNVELTCNEEKLNSIEFKNLWSHINSKSVYAVDFDSEELIRNAINSMNRSLHVPKVYFTIETGEMKEIKSKQELISGTSFVKESSPIYDKNRQRPINHGVKYDLVGKIVEKTHLTRKDIVRILTGISKDVFDQFHYNPEDFIIKASKLINDEKATAVIEHITYQVMDAHYETDIFTEPTIKGKLGINAMKAKKHLYDHVVYDSKKEETFAKELDASNDVAIYVKLPDSFYISTPVGRYNPDWAIAFYANNVKHIFFVAETKGSLSSMSFRRIEEAKIHCAREHFKAISNKNVVYDVVDSYKMLMEKVMK